MMYAPAMWLWPYTIYSMWLNAAMAPWMAMAQAGGLPPAAAAIPAAPLDPAAAVGLDAVGPKDIGTSATDFRPEAEK